MSKNYEDVIEEFEKKFSVDVADIKTTRHLATKWLRTALQSQADQYKREKMEIFVELCDIFEGNNDRDIINVGAILCIAQKYGVDTQSLN